MESSNSGGVKVITIAGRMARERERCIGMTDEERAYRARYVKSLELAPGEPITPKGYYEAYYNPIRRFYMAPLNQVEKLLAPAVGDFSARVIRFTTGRILMGITGIYVGWYYFKYHTYTWERQSGWRICPTRDARLPGTKDYKGLEKRTIFATDNFENSPI
ncbi:uncharacterized protein LOC108626665 [Ceratina calcarata]|uniref:Uncharacterized protein LOC108626664 n=1 Tax=Ceratina calcarata TaxID=156304 RepID=A0AAJ7N8J1_9HYME|nr:uncharacterized protein LOC108626664 [Ceratina calcarata]XP_017882961.1 uncharacterized protein LOC108626665 [Ceratina calcarata]